MTTETIIAVVSAVGALLSGTATAAAVYVSYNVQKSQRLLSQRQLLLPLWDHMASLSDIDPDQPVLPDIIKVVNTLELVALCCEGGMVDRAVIMRTFRDQYAKHYENIKRCGKLPILNIDGESLLQQNRAAVVLYTQLTQERLNQDRLNK
ncbi:hypothetical protein BR1R5_21750 [Pseudomonas sp. BR1R-5]|uniref:hypothetical protein n=1 Tax=Pseudomonas sp. BR1R-5 TaxID=3003626 RepID=UPI0022C63E06|nr:hypothetical protein [Pseudomonas sp. BR1R-5]GLH32788.1 hypothetical protein BR1R5_21750 [Pseudomonas sp. BR1R-5]